MTFGSPLFDDTQQSGKGSQDEGTRSESAVVEDESTMKEEFSSKTLMTRVFSIAKIVDRHSPLLDPALVGGM